MGILGSTVLSSTTSVGGVSTTCYTLNEDGTVDEKKRNRALTTTVLTSASATAGEIISQYNLRKIHHEYTSAYVDSLNDEQLEELYNKLNLLESENIDKNNNKTV